MLPGRAAVRGGPSEEGSLLVYLPTSLDSQARNPQVIVPVGLRCSFTLPLGSLAV